MVDVLGIRWVCTHGAAGWVVLGVFDVISLNFCRFRLKSGEERLGK